MSNLESFPKSYSQAWSELENTAEQINLELDPTWLESEIKGDQILEKLWQNVKAYAYQYTEVVCEFMEDQLRGNDRESLEDRQFIDEKRKRKHDAFIDSLGILSRNMRKCGKDGSWYEMFGNNRAKQGLWAIKFTYNKIVESLNQENGEGE